MTDIITAIAHEIHNRTPNSVLETYNAASCVLLSQKTIVVMLHRQAKLTVSFERIPTTTHALFEPIEENRIYVDECDPEEIESAISESTKWLLKELSHT